DRRTAGREVSGRIDGYDGFRIVREAIEVVRIARRGVDNVRAKQIVACDLRRVSAHVHQDGLFFAAVTNTESAADHQAIIEILLQQGKRSGAPGKANLRSNIVVASIVEIAAYAYRCVTKGVSS